MSCRILEVWEILVPKFSYSNEIDVSHHEIWDKEVLRICGGLTLREINTGKWMGQNGETIKEDMIAVRIACTTPQMHLIMEFTKQHYNQEAVFAMKISNVALIHE